MREEIEGKTEVEAMAMERLAPILARYRDRRGALIPLLQEVQEEFGYLAEGVMRALAEALDVSPAQLYGVASFYTQFYFEPRGKNIIRVCTGTACHIRGALGVLERFEKELGIKAGETSPDLKFTLETVNCVGCCGLAPVVVVNEQVIKKKDHPKVIARLKGEGEE